uniref:malonyl-coenzyme A:anthocyanin 3-O-glucoside-6''-O-malonyltransferase-like n=1 Tax=Erigeron canadensis TaxID=72917 RepID=UPI001CB8BCE6|nr:malonyl-coenzyme A:anthocyanin 3-O-glucoside-6''-O-malonyltransferase-like [Erigeron canadensis]
MADMTCLNVIEKCKISAPPNSVGERSLPLTFFDLAWLLFHPVHQLFFYDFPHSKSHFIETVIPNLKHSLSITLQHFFPFASNLVVLPNANHSGLEKRPEIFHVEGDSVMLTFAECNHLDFNDLKGNHPRDCNKFHPLVPLLEDAFKVSRFVKIPLFSIQVTIFPNNGITIGLTNLHVLCDAKTRYHFLMAWTSIFKFGTDELFLASGSLPCYDRVVIKYPNSLDEIVLSRPQVQTLGETYKAPQLAPLPDKVRATFVLTRSQINRVKKWLLVQLPKLEYVSAYTVCCGYVWSCIAKSRLQVEGKKGEYELERFVCIIDLRARLDPPVPQTYFGNCLIVCSTPTNTSLLTGMQGFSNAVEVLGTSIKKTINHKEGVLKEAETWLKKSHVRVPTIGVAGTSKQNVYNLDFGWGNPKKYETISLDYNDSISLNASKDSPEDIEIGVCLPAKQMDAFLTISRNELESILANYQE